MPLHYAYIPNKKAWKKAMEEFNRTDPYKQPSGATCSIFRNPSRTTTVVLIYINTDKIEELTLEQTTALLAHECVHAMQFLCEHIEEEKPSLEFFAYGVQTIYQRILTDFIEFHKKDIKHWLQ